MKDCCEKCENLSTSKTESLYVNEKRKSHKRWNEKYSEEELENIKNVLLNNYDSSDETISSGILNVPKSMFDCISTLQQKSGRPFYGFVNKLAKLDILIKKYNKINSKIYVKYTINLDFFDKEIK